MHTYLSQLEKEIKATKEVISCLERKKRKLISLDMFCQCGPLVMSKKMIKDMHDEMNDLQSRIMYQEHILEHLEEKMAAEEKIIADIVRRVIEEDR